MKYELWYVIIMNLNTVVAEEVYSCITSLCINYENKLKELKLRKIDHDVFHFCIRKEYQNGNKKRLELTI